MTLNNLKKSATKTLLAVGVFFLAVSCNKKQHEDVAERFLNHMANAEFEKAKEFCDEQTASMVSMMASFAGENTKESDKKEKVTIISSELNEAKDKATVKYTSTAEEGEKTIDLSLIDGNWKVSMDKENENKEQGTPNIEDALEGFEELSDSLEHFEEEFSEE